MYTKVVYFLTSFCLSVLALDIGDTCITPNGEVANCIQHTECHVIKNAILSRVEGAKPFAQKSKCGNIGKSPLVCCGTTAKFMTIAPPKKCTTPNGESASCVPLSSCKLISDALETHDNDAEKFAKESHCGHEREQLVCCGSEAYPLRTNLLPNRTVCGEQTGVVRIMGGEETKILEFPWMALLMYNFHNGSHAGFRCGGSVINNRYVLTAAHCVSISENLPIYLNKVRLGEWKISTVEDCDEEFPSNCADPVIDLNIEEKIVHPQYKLGEGKNDIALLRLERNIEYTNSIRPICLPVGESPDPRSRSEMYVAGWGATENSSSSDVKLKLKLQIASRSYCNERLNSIGGVDFTQICAGGKRGEDSCKGDSGGPLMRSSTSENLNANPKWFQEGIVSRGIHCGIRGVPGIYARVAYYMHWIIDNLRSF
ncbi:hypothetical protein ILUMI_07941 [Ignelater luminosus]|uniref:CLIP domain-containing serine protease n=1 Tax=Ignelater luminosus TaxID=2038154 RepID=A0A8K0D2X1_IGNLU|nr:hypothetical protein ILUMI_07941 [Ignelater luminosus]